ncbi:MAG: MerR family transcriptional regulator [Aeromicrobium sp.]
MTVTVTGTLTIDDLSAEAGLSVRTTRYYASLGLLPPAERHGRQVYYGEQHLARLRLIRTLQSHGHTLAAIEAYLRRIPGSTTPEHLGVQRSILSSWAPHPATPVSREDLAQLAGRPLTDDDLTLMERSGVLRRLDDGFAVLPGFEVSLELCDMDVPAETVIAAAQTIDAHMTRLADDLENIMLEHVLRPLRDGRRPAPSEEVLARLSALTTEAVAAGFRRATDAMIHREVDGS